MTTFIIVAALMVATALAWVLWPLLRPSNRTSVERRMVNLSVYKDQFADLEGDFARGSISEDNYKEAKAELERRMLEESRVEKSAAAPVPVGGVKTALVIGAAIPVIAGLLYAKLGAPDAFSPLATAPQDQHQLSGAQVDEMVAKLAARLEKEPDNVDGWVMLARTYYQQRKFPEAARAYEKLTQLVPNEADLYSDYADALAMAQGRNLAGKPMELVKKALELDPNQWKALAMAGTEAFDRKDYKSAITYWERLKANAGDEPIGKQIQASIDEARKLAGLPPSAPTAPVAAAASKAVPA
ncbi:MAG: c-type cytochrome biogenesis protein CcmI, partial [Burkholderiaceae bacterium]